MRRVLPPVTDPDPIPNASIRRAGVAVEDSGAVNPEHILEVIPAEGPEREEVGDLSPAGTDLAEPLKAGSVSAGVSR